MPSLEDFPELRGGSTLQALYERICKRINIDPERVRLEVVPGKQPPWFVDDRGYAASYEAAHYERNAEGERIHLAADGIGDPMGLIGTLAHELCHARLMGEGRLHGAELDHELLTDLCAFYHGFGLFLANQPRAWPSDCGVWPGTSLVRPEYMTSNLAAWTLAHRALLAGEHDPAWIVGLGPEPRRLVSDGIRWLREHQDSAFLNGDWSASDDLLLRLVDAAEECPPSAADQGPPP